jgi:hypothetical protein
MRVNESDGRMASKSRAARRLVLQLRRRIECNSEEAGELTRTLLTEALDDVRRNRHRGSDDLALERRVLGLSDVPSDPVTIHGHQVGLLPDFELLEISHTA